MVVTNPAGKVVVVAPAVVTGEAVVTVVEAEVPPQAARISTNPVVRALVFLPITFSP
jgi:hypothetical protein